MPTPPTNYNFASLPHIQTRDALYGDPALPARIARGEGYLGTPRQDRRETLTIESARGTPDYIVVYPANTRLPILMSAVTGLFFLSFLLKLYWFAPVPLAGVAVCAWVWVWGLGQRRDQGPEDVGLGVTLPHAGEVDRAPGWWGSLFLLVADAVLFGSLIFGYAFLFTVAPGWPPPEWLAPSLLELVGGIAGAVVAATGMRAAIRANRRGGSARTGLAVAGAGALVVLLALVALLVRTPPPTAHAYSATLFVLGGYGIFHTLIPILMLCFLAARLSHGFVSAARRAELAIAGLWVDYMAVVAILVLAVAHLPGVAS